MNWVHNERRLDAVHGAITAIDALDLTGDEAVSHVARTSATKFFWYGDAEKAECAHLIEDGAVRLFFEIGGNNARQQFFLGIGPRSFADHSLIIRQLVVEEKWILPVKNGFGRGHLGSLVLHGLMSSDNTFAVRQRVACWR